MRHITQVVTLPAITQSVYGTDQTVSRCQALCVGLKRLSPGVRHSVYGTDKTVSRCQALCVWD